GERHEADVEEDVLREAEGRSDLAWDVPSERSEHRPDADRDSEDSGEDREGGRPHLQGAPDAERAEVRSGPRRPHEGRGHRGYRQDASQQDEAALRAEPLGRAPVAGLGGHGRLPSGPGVSGASPGQWVVPPTHGGLRGPRGHPRASAWREPRPCRSIRAPSSPARPRGDRRSRETTYGARRSRDRKSTRLNSSHVSISYAVF